MEKNFQVGVVFDGQVLANEQGSKFMQKITSQDNPRLKNAIRLHTTRGRKSQERILVFGLREIKRAIENGVFPDELFICETNATDDQLSKLLSENAERIPKSSVCQLPGKLYEKVNFGDRNDGVVMTAKRPERSLKDVQFENTRDSSPLVLIVEAIEKPGNLGAIMRSADGAGVDALVVTAPVTDWYHPNAIRASMGAAFSIPGATATNEMTMAWLQANEFNIYSAALQTENSFYDFELTGPTAIILGSEARGLSNEWRGEIHNLKTGRLPMLGIGDSLNVSVTAAIMLYEARRQRSAVKQ